MHITASTPEMTEIGRISVVVQVSD